MNKKKTTVKGFTLIELIIVLAIFSVIMTLVMSLIDPVSKLMTKTSVRERTAAYVDNIGEYVSKSIRHAQNIVVYEHGLYSSDYAADACTEETLVRDFVDTYYNGAVYYDGSNNYPLLNGKVHVLKLINEDDGTLKAGRIYESVYNFTAGSGIPTTVYFDPNVLNDYVDDSTIAANLNSFRAAHTADDDEKKSWSDEEILTNEYGYTKLTKIIFDSDDKHSKPVLQSGNVSVINDEHFKDYSYYYQLGMYTFDPITNPEDHGLTSDSKYFYSRLNKMTGSSGATISDSVNEYQFVMNVVSFMDNAQNTDNKIDCPVSDDEGNAPADTEVFSAFKSPAAMSSVGMTLKNVQMQKESRSVKYYRKVLDSDGNQLDKDGKVIVPGSAAIPAIEAVTNNLGVSPFRRETDGYLNAEGEKSNNIYMIFTVPTEIMDTEWNDAQPATAGGPMVG